MKTKSRVPIGMTPLAALIVRETISLRRMLVLSCPGTNWYFLWRQPRTSLSSKPSVRFIRVYRSLRRFQVSIVLILKTSLFLISQGHAIEIAIHHLTNFIMTLRIITAFLLLALSTRLKIMIIIFRVPTTPSKFFLFPKISLLLNPSRRLSIIITIITTITLIIIVTAILTTAYLYPGTANGSPHADLLCYPNGRLFNVSDNGVGYGNSSVEDAYTSQSISLYTGMNDQNINFVSLQPSPDLRMLSTN